MSKVTKLDLMEVQPGLERVESKDGRASLMVTLNFCVHNDSVNYVTQLICVF